MMFFKGGTPAFYYKKGRDNYDPNYPDSFPFSLDVLLNHYEFHGMIDIKSGLSVISDAIIKKIDDQLDAVMKSHENSPIDDPNLPLEQLKAGLRYYTKEAVRTENYEVLMDLKKIFNDAVDSDNSKFTWL